MSGLGLVVSGLPNDWLKLLLGVALMLISPFCDKFLEKLLTPGLAEAEAHRENKAKRKARSKYIAQNREQIGFQYFKSTFLFAGHIAAADGTVCDNEMRLFDDFCLKLRLDNAQIQAAKDYFNQGRSPQFNATEAMNAFVAQCGDIEPLCESFLQMQFAFVEASGMVVGAEFKAIKTLSQRLNAQHVYADALEAFQQSAALHAEKIAKQRIEDNKRERDKRRFKAEQQRQAEKLTPAQRELRLAFAVLGLPPTKNISHIKRAYRSQIKRHHPDYLLANGYPEALLQEATERSVKINQAYRLLKNKLQFK